MMSNSIKFGLVASALFVAVGVVLYFMARENDPGDYRSLIGHVQQIQQLASDWSVETARVRSDPLADYDALAAFIPRMDERKAELLGTVQGIPGIPDRLANDVSAFASALDAKEERIERFKTANSVVRNSARYLPVAAANIVQHEDVGADLAREVSSLASEINDYLAAPSDPAKGRLTAVLERLDERAVGLSERLANAVLNFIAHASVLLDRQGPTDEFFEQATSNEIADVSERLIGVLGTEVGRVEQRAGMYMNGILGTAGGLLLLWIVLAVVRSRPQAAAAAGEATLADAAPALADGAPAAVAASAPRATPADKLLLSQRILGETVARRIAEASDGIAASAESLPVENGHAEDVRRAAEEIGALADRLCTLSTGHDVAYDLLDLTDCIDEAVDATGAASVAAVTTEKADSPELFASRTEICLLLEKIIENSVQAIQEKGFGPDNGDKGEIRIATGGDGENAVVTVIDNGVGMATDVQARMWEPFFTSKENRAGIGLTTTSHLVEKYGGRLFVSSHEGGGTVTRVELPGVSAQ